ncbi:ABC transporter substrate-binding protein [Metabacillus bambusae]|uniref:Sugar ABC transporter substrate-binding protein n=1 Tax=Metabacillus bambusae TaxID=2795218 RepID=A0ABS3N7A2_9BACI|nr:sugar ABC transporter substrate-binding protein [Metabacillus bambusae]MBO1514137.1 sugar ABC transporter substrate-binding protein [Metabacillus bambusae]
MLKKVMLTVLFMSFVFLIACSGDASSTESNSKNKANGEKISIDWWDPATGKNAEELDKIIAEYEEENPNVDIVRTFTPFADIKNKLMMSSAAGELPDITILDNPAHQPFAASGMLADITDKVKEAGLEDKYFEGPWSTNVYDGKIYGIPSYSNNLALFYNKDLLKEAGYDEPPKTWEELKEIAAATTKDGVRGLSFSAIQNEVGVFHFLPWLWQSGSDLTNLNSEGTVETLNLWKDLIDKGHVSQEVLSLDQNDLVLTFAAGSEAMMVNGTWQVPVLNEEAKINWGVTTLPKGKESGTVLGGYNWAITEQSEHKDIAWDIIQFAEEKERKLGFLKNAGYIPSRKDLIDDPHWTENEVLNVFADSMEFAKARAYGPKYEEISVEIQSMIHSVMQGDKTPEEAAKEAANKIKPLLP